MISGVPSSLVHADRERKGRHVSFVRDAHDGPADALDVGEDLAIAGVFRVSVAFAVLIVFFTASERRAVRPT